MNHPLIRPSWSLRDSETSIFSSRGEWPLNNVFIVTPSYLIKKTGCKPSRVSAALLSQTGTTVTPGL